MALRSQNSWHIHSPPRENRSCMNARTIDSWYAIRDARYRSRIVRSARTHGCCYRRTGKFGRGVFSRLSIMPIQLDSADQNSFELSLNSRALLTIRENGRLLTRFLEFSGAWLGSISAILKPSCKLFRRGSGVFPLRVLGLSIELNYNNVSITFLARTQRPFQCLDDFVMIRRDHGNGTECNVTNNERSNDSH